jgi:hypothetical protein
MAVFPNAAKGALIMLVASLYLTKTTAHQTATTQRFARIRVATISYSTLTGDTAHCQMQPQITLCIRVGAGLHIPLCYGKPRDRCSDEAEVNNSGQVHLHRA